MLDLRDPAAPPRVLAYAEVCGLRLSVGSAPVIVVGRAAIDAPDLLPGAVLLIDARDGRLLRRDETPTEPVDVLIR